MLETETVSVVDELEAYWLKRGSTYMRDMQRRPDRYGAKLTRKLLEVLKPLKFRSVFEPGCAYGRLVKALLTEFPNVSVAGLDLSPVQIANAQKYVSDSRAMFMLGRIQDFNLPRTFDLVVTFSFLMHIPDTEIEAVMRKLCFLSAKHVVNVEWDYPMPKRLKHCFSHDYAGIYRKLGFAAHKFPVSRRWGFWESIWTVNK